MKKIITIPLILLLTLLSVKMLPAQVPGLIESEEIFAPFASRFKAETKGSVLFLSWKDARNLEDSVYQIYSSSLPFSSGGPQLRQTSGQCGSGG